MSHLNEEQLIALRDGESVPAGAREHLATCPKCAKRLFKLRRLLALRPAPIQRIGRRLNSSLDAAAEGPEGVGEQFEQVLQTWTTSAASTADQVAEPHADPDELRGLVHNALDDERTKLVQRHLQACNHCLAIFDRLGQLEAARGWASPSPAALARARAIFTRRQPATIGQIVVAKVKDALKLLFEPGPAWVGAGKQLAADASVQLAAIASVQEAPLVCHRSAIEFRAVDDGQSGPIEAARQLLQSLEERLEKLSGLRETLAHRASSGEWLTALSRERVAVSPSDVLISISRELEAVHEAEAGVSHLSQEAAHIAEELQRVIGSLERVIEWLARDSGPAIGSLSPRLAWLGEIAAEFAQLDGVTIPLDAQLLFVAARPEGDDATLVVTILDADSLEPARGFEFRLLPQDGDPVSLETDARGRAETPLPAGTSSLVIEHPGPYRLILENAQHD